MNSHPTQDPPKSINTSFFPLIFVFYASVVDTVFQVHRNVIELYIYTYIIFEIIFLYRLL